VGASAYYYRKLLPAVLRAGRRVIAMDLRGHGGSDKPMDESLYTADAMAARRGLSRVSTIASTSWPIR
jgi:haloalkane dehalogenase